MNPAAKVTLGLPRKILWRSKSGKQVVVGGPFPPGMYRSDTRRHVNNAARINLGDMYSHPEGTTKEEDFCLVNAEDITEVDERNEYGEICP